ncbi:unnamed protein product [Phaedon cochleariae]|uniref:Uncharacterized protein n=1 Tax=Phaedon cochleariae TaxID=80249 RepID=A0A9P0D921_PHACE|nr:unnamed protein product [Phaedon cochleariae]
MKLFVIFILLTLFFVIDCYGDEILEYQRNQNEHGYHFKYITSSRQEREETGVIENVGGQFIMRIKGYFSYFNLDGDLYEVSYTADEGGYRSEGHLIPYSDEKQSGESHPPFPTLRISPAALASLAGGGLG